MKRTVCLWQECFSCHLMRGNREKDDFSGLRPLSTLLMCFLAVFSRGSSFT
jgi:hypothetical protein